MKADERDLRLWAIVCWPDGVVYAQRPSREEAERVFNESLELIEKFGRPTIEAPVVVPLDLPAKC